MLTAEDTKVRGNHKRELNDTKVATQLWIITFDTANKVYRIQNAATRTYFDLEGGMSRNAHSLSHTPLPCLCTDAASADDGTAINVAASSDDEGQRWKIIRNDKRTAYV